MALKRTSRDARAASARATASPAILVVAEIVSRRRLDRRRDGCISMTVEFNICRFDPRILPWYRCTQLYTAGAACLDARMPHCMKLRNTVYRSHGSWYSRLSSQ